MPKPTGDDKNLKTPPKARTIPHPPVTKAERVARMRADKMVIKRMRKR